MPLIWQDGKTTEIDEAELAAPGVSAPTLELYRHAIQRRIDDAAGERGYDSAASCASYATSTVPAWQAEAQALIAWRDAVWVYAHAELDKVQRGVRPQPSVDDFLGELPAISWPQPEGET